MGMVRKPNHPFPESAAAASAAAGAKVSTAEEASSPSERRSDEKRLLTVSRWAMSMEDGSIAESCT